MQTSFFSLSLFIRRVLASVANLCLNHMVIFPILSFHFLPGTPLERKKSLPPPLILMITLNLWILKTYSMFWQYMAVVMLLRLFDSYLANGVPSSWWVNFWLDPTSFEALPCFLARCSRLSFVLSGPEAWNQPLLGEMLFLLWAVVSRYQDSGHSPLG